MKQRHTEKVTCRFLHNPKWICFYWGGLVVVVVVVFLFLLLKSRWLLVLLSVALVYLGVVYVAI